MYEKGQQNFNNSLTLTTIAELESNKNGNERKWLLSMLIHTADKTKLDELLWNYRRGRLWL